MNGEGTTEVLHVDFGPKRGDVDGVALRVKQKDYLACQHPNVVIDEEQRTVKCKACEQVLDPVWVVLQWAKNWGRYAGQVKALRGEAQQRTDEIVKLRAEEQRIKARIRTASGRVRGQSIGS